MKLGKIEMHLLEKTDIERDSYIFKDLDKTFTDSWGRNLKKIIL